MKKSILLLSFSLLTPSAFSDSAWTYGVSETAGWYDYNKSWDGDTNLCWAASASNMICWWQDYSSYSGKAASGTPSGSAVWDTFRSSFNDLGGASVFAYEWYYQGSYPPLEYPNFYDNSQWSTPVNTTSIGGYYTSANLDFNTLTSYDDYRYDSGTTNSYSVFSAFIVDSLKSGYGLSLGISNLGGTQYVENTLGHAMTMWGCDYTTAKDGTISITALYITDSDDDYSGLHTVECYEDETNGYFCFSSDYYNEATQTAYGDFYIQDITGLNLIESIPEPASLSFFLAGMTGLLLRRKKH